MPLTQDPSFHFSTGVIDRQNLPPNPLIANIDDIPSEAKLWSTTDLPSIAPPKSMAQQASDFIAARPIAFIAIAAILFIGLRRK
jgi:hypothetical protein